MVRISSGEEEAEWRVSTISWSSMMTRAHWITATPISTADRPAVRPKPTFCALAWRMPKSMTMSRGTAK